MHTTIFQRIIDKAEADTTLLNLLGVVTLDPTNSPIRRAQTNNPSRIPSITFKGGNLTGGPLPGSDAAIDVPGSLISRDDVDLQVDIWVSSEGGTSPDNLSYPQTGEDADIIEDRLNTLFVRDTKNLVQGTFGWGITSHSQQNEGTDTGLWHNVVRYRLSYYIITGFVPE
jgi:hypothetical protein